MRALVLAALVAQAAPRPQPAPQQASQQPAPQQAPTKQSAPLSGEDEELVKELALLERVELLQNLELFEAGPKDEDQPPQTRAH